MEPVWQDSLQRRSFEVVFDDRTASGRPTALC